MVKDSITTADIEKAHASFQAQEPHDIFYRTATILVDLALRREIAITVEEALAVLLQTWNKNFYRFKKEFNAAHFEEIRSVLTKHGPLLAECRERNIEDLQPDDQPGMAVLFEAFEEVLGAVGAAKALHLLAPKLFPLWDTAIAKGYHVPLNRVGSKSCLYWEFMKISKKQCCVLRKEGWRGDNALKAIDEYNYCRYTLVPKTKGKPGSPRRPRTRT